MKKINSGTIKKAMMIAITVISVNLLVVGIYNNYFKKTKSVDNIGTPVEVEKPSIDYSEIGNSNEQENDNKQENKNEQENEIAEIYNDDTVYPPEGDMGNIDKLAIGSIGGIEKSVNTDEIKFTIGTKSDNTGYMTFNPKIEPVNGELADTRFILTIGNFPDGMILPDYASSYEDLTNSGEKIILQLDDIQPLYYRTSIKDGDSNFGFDPHWYVKDPINYIFNIVGLDSGRFYGSFNIWLEYDENINKYKFTSFTENKAALSSEQQERIDEQLYNLLHSEEHSYWMYEFDEANKLEFNISRLVYNNLTELNDYGYKEDNDFEDRTKPYLCVALNMADETEASLLVYFSNGELTMLGYKMLMNTVD